MISLGKEKVDDKVGFGVIGYGNIVAILCSPYYLIDSTQEIFYLGDNYY